jgi:hypothetical protein
MDYIQIVHRLRVKKAVRLTRSSSASAVWNVFDLDGQNLGLWISKLGGYGWCATYAPGADMDGMRLASMMRGKAFATRHELLDEIAYAVFARQCSE